MLVINSRYIKLPTEPDPGHRVDYPDYVADSTTASRTHGPELI